MVERWVRWGGTRISAYRCSVINAKTQFIPVDVGRCGAAVKVLTAACAWSAVTEKNTQVTFVGTVASAMLSTLANGGLQTTSTRAFAAPL